MPINVSFFGLKRKYDPKKCENEHFVMHIAFELLNENL